MVLRCSANHYEGERLHCPSALDFFTTSMCCPQFHTQDPHERGVLSEDAVPGRHSNAFDHCRCHVCDYALFADHNVKRGGCLGTSRTATEAHRLHSVSRSFVGVGQHEPCNCAHDAGSCGNFQASFPRRVRLWFECTHAPTSH